MATATVQFLCPRRAAGGLIGTGGAVVQLCAAQHATTVALSRRDDCWAGGDARRCTVRGASADACIETHALLIAVLAGLRVDAEAARRDARTNERGTDSAPTPTTGPPRLSADACVARAVRAISALRSPRAAHGALSAHAAALDAALPSEHTILVPRATVGAVIGSRGARIREICAESGAFVRVGDAPDDERVDERPVRIVGRTRALLAAARMVALTMWAPRRDGTPAAGYATPSSASGGGGSESPDGSGGDFYGYAAHQALAAAMGVRPPAAHRSAFEASRDAWRGPGPANDGMCDDGNSFVKNIAVPDALIGQLVGAKGASLARIVAASQCKISISQRGEFVEGSLDRTVSFEGPSANILLAQALVRQRIRQVNVEREYRSGGGGGGGGGGERGGGSSDE